MATANVLNFNELKSAIEDSTTTEIIAQADITFSGGIKVNIAKSNLVVDFGGHTITDNNSASLTDTIYVPSTSNTISVIVKNAVWSGRNYYGVVGVNGNANTTIELNNIKYKGPQFVYNKNGTTKIIDCEVSIEKNDSSTNPQEFCEVNRLIISGNVNVTSYSSSDAVIWFTNTNASLTVTENSNFNIVASLTYLLYTDVSPIMTFEKNSSTTIATKSGLFYASGSSSHIANSFTLEENASFIAYKQDSNSIPMFKCVSNFTLKPNSTFMLFSEIISSTPLLYFGSTANIQIDNPKSVVLYDRGGSVFKFQTGSASSPNLISINTEMMRLWNYAKSPLSDAGGFSDTPTTEYFKKDYASNLSIEIKATSSALSSVDSNIESEDSGYPMTTTSLKLLTSNVISMGKLILNVDEINDLSTSISGTSNSLANMKIEYDGNTFETTSLDNGEFDFPLSEKLAINTIVNVSTNQEFLTKTMPFKSVGSVYISSLPSIHFNAFTSNSNRSVIYRQDPNWNIEITDTRLEGDNWYLYAHILNPLTSPNDTLKDALIFKENNLSQVLSETPILIHTGKRDEKSNKTTLTWSNIEGFLLAISPSITYSHGDYQTNILWQVTTDLIE